MALYCYCVLAGCFSMKSVTKQFEKHNELQCQEEQRIKFMGYGLCVLYVFDNRFFSLAEEYRRSQPTVPASAPQSGMVQSCRLIIYILRTETVC